MHLDVEIVAYYFWATVTLTSDLSCIKIVYWVYPFYYRQKTLKFGMWMHLLAYVCHILFRSLWPWPLTTVLDRLSSDNICILCEVGIQNLVCGYILVLRSVAHCFWVTLTLASGLGLRKIEETPRNRKPFWKIEGNVCAEVWNNFSTTVLHSSRNCEIACLL